MHWIAHDLPLEVLSREKVQNQSWSTLHQLESLNPHQFDVLGIRNL